MSGPHKLWLHFPDKTRDRIFFLISVLAFAAFMGIVIPPFMRLAFDLHLTLSPLFWAISLFFGLLVASINYLFFKIMDDSRQIDFLSKLAIDEKTGLLNRNFTMRRWNEEFARSVRQKAPICLVLIRVDHFRKLVSDENSKTADEVLKDIAAHVKAGVRSCDVAGCLEDGKFMAVLQGAEIRNAAIMAERLRWIIDTSPPKVGDKAIRATVSCGISSFSPERAEKPEDVYQKAVAALRFATDAGGNQIAANFDDRLELLKINLEPNSSHSPKPE